MTNDQQILIRPIAKRDIDEARKVIMSVAKSIFGWEQSIDEISCMLTSEGELGDLQDIQRNYIEMNGIFFVAVDRGRVIGTGGICGISEDVCELKRLWLLEQYHGKGIGYRITDLLLKHAVCQGFTKIRLVTSPLQSRAIQFYRKVGFEQVGTSGNGGDEIVFEMSL